MEENERAFKGIWIPKEIWLNKELSLQEKVIIVEIESLDNDKGCYASNKYFASFFNLSNGRVSQIINGLIKKGWINAEYKKDGKQIVKRILRINKPPYPEVFNILNRGIKYSKEGYLENDKDNNIKNNNINKQKEILLDHFTYIWKEYPNKKGKAKAIELYLQWTLKGKNISGAIIKLTDEQVYNAVVAYKKECEKNNTETKYIKHADTFFNKAILDYVEDLNE